MQFYCAATTADPSRVLDVLAANRADPFAVRRACVELARLVLAEPTATARGKLIEHPELLVTLVGAAAEHVDKDELVLADCCRFLRRTIDLRAPSELDVQTRIAETGVLKLLARGLQRHPRSAPLFCEVCRLVALLCFDMPFAPHADNQTDACAAGLLHTICERLRSEDSDVSIEEAQLGVDAISAMVYENVSNAEDAVASLQVIALLSSLLERFPRAPSRFVQSVAQSLFQILTLQHAAKDALCACGGPLALVKAVRTHQRAAAASALQYVACMLLSRVAVSESASDPPAPHKIRIDALVQSGAHELALAVLKKASAGGDSSAGSDTAQALRLLELLAAIEAHRIPLTRLGASRAITVLYNGADTSAALRVLCERAVAAVEGT